jgi:hypothetical protein
VALAADLPRCIGELSDRQELKGDAVKSICEHLPGADLLVFGTGFDSLFWVVSNENGTTRFLEDNAKSVESQPEEVRIGTTVVEYSCSVGEALTQLKNQTMLEEFYNSQLPQEVKSRYWDVVLVDGPTSGSAANNSNLCAPGRGQSIFAASLLVRPTGYVYVDDCDGKIEQEYVNTYFTQKGWTIGERLDNGHGSQMCVLSRASEQAE